MKTETTISKINTELIRSFATLDAWFDKALDDGDKGRNRWSMQEVIQHILNSNYHLLDLLSDGCEYAWSHLQSQDGKLTEERSLDDMRFALREQLFHCLCLLDELGDNAEVNQDVDKAMNIQDRLWSITHHLTYHLERLQDAEVAN
jgi:uncharacterized damage-inducible protein DinB